MAATTKVDDEANPVTAQQQAQLTLQTWFSASFPIGAFSYSHGLEWAIASDDVCSAGDCEIWIGDLLRFGSARNDLIVMNQAWQAQQENDYIRLLNIDALSVALSAGAERREESIAMADAFRRSVRAMSPPEAIESHPFSDSIRSLPAVVGALAALHELPRRMTLLLAGQSFTSNLVWIGARLLPFGQFEALRMISQLRESLLDTLNDVEHADVDAIGSGALLADFASLAHEQLPSRVCQT